MELVAGPIVAVLLSLGYTQWKTKQHEAAITEIEQRLEIVQKSEEEMPKKVMATVMPIAKAVQRLNVEVGIKWVK